MPQEDEPFEFFRGFSEIFISIGLIILLSGVGAVLAWFGGLTLLTVVPLICAGVAWWWAGYFTLKRRMTLPSMVLASAYGVGIYVFIVTLLGQADAGERALAIGGFSLAALAMVGWYLRFKLPFSAFLTGLFALGAVYATTASMGNIDSLIGNRGMDVLFDLRESPAFATATLAFGVAAFIIGMYFDTRDPHRLGRHSATAFWCHLLAAPALVNTVAMTLLNTGGDAGIGLLTLALLGITVLALVIDRRSFLTAAIAYIAIVIAWIAGDSADFGTWAFILIALGGLITAIGTWWVQLRAFVMRILPNFPGKSSLPPYSRAE
ncbi:MAG: hypothetical protein JNK34_06535 [Tabrizicola sp.]|nr:hypothetical protein [Tabrizicola sp.]